MLPAVSRAFGDFNGSTVTEDDSPEDSGPATPRHTLQWKEARYAPRPSPLTASEPLHEKTPHIFPRHPYLDEVFSPSDIHRRRFKPMNASSSSIYRAQLPSTKLGQRGMSPNDDDGSAYEGDAGQGPFPVSSPTALDDQTLSKLIDGEQPLNFQLTESLSAAGLPTLPMYDNILDSGRAVSAATTVRTSRSGTARSMLSAFPSETTARSQYASARLLEAMPERKTVARPGEPQGFSLPLNPAVAALQQEQRPNTGPSGHRRRRQLAAMDDRRNSEILSSYYARQLSALRSMGPASDRQGEPSGRPMTPSTLMSSASGTDDAAPSETQQEWEAAQSVGRYLGREVTASARSFHSLPSKSSATSRVNFAEVPPDSDSEPSEALNNIDALTSVHPDLRTLAGPVTVAGSFGDHQKWWNEAGEQEEEGERAAKEEENEVSEAPDEDPSMMSEADSEEEEAVKRGTRATALL